MIIDMPDQYPGRCLNTRTNLTMGGSSVEVLRCLDYEGVPHVCSFPKPITLTIDTSSWGAIGSLSTVTPPKRWVKP